MDIFGNTGISFKTLNNYILSLQIKCLCFNKYWKSERFGFFPFWISNGMNGKLVQCAAQIKEQTKLFLAILEHISKKDLTHISSDAAGLWAGLIVPAKKCISPI